MISTSTRNGLQARSRIGARGTCRRESSLALFGFSVRRRLCMVVIPSDELRRMKDMEVFIVTVASASCDFRTARQLDCLEAW